MEDSIVHRPVLAREVISFLDLKKTYRVLDATVGLGGHSKKILEVIKPDGLLIGTDCDETAIKLALGELQGTGGKLVLVHANFRDIDKVLSKMAIDAIDGAIFDLGVSSYQLGSPGRGFSFVADGPLDMRMDLRESLSASQIVNKYSKERLEEIIRDFGEERYFRRIAGAIVERRRESPIDSTDSLSHVVLRAVGGRYRSQRIHPATRTFQAVRIAVNRELDSLTEGLCKVVDFLGPGRRVCVISFHSLEDRIVKHKFKDFKSEGKGNILTKKPIVPTAGEIACNARSRSAKLRVFEKGKS